MLRKVVSLDEGTANFANIKGYDVGGKTGTALKYGSKAKLNTFVSLFPASRPKYVLFLMLDEPFAGIDPIAVADIQEIIQALKQKNIGILVTDHNVQGTLSITDRAYIINEGVILESGNPEAIVSSPKARAIYLGERFKL